LLTYIIKKIGKLNKNWGDKNPNSVNHPNRQNQNNKNKMKNKKDPQSDSNPKQL